jgi:hypothetical protein
VKDADTITYSEAVAEHGQQLIDAIMTHDRHYWDEQGRVFWFRSDFAEAFELVEIERRSSTEADKA